jgi:hypothetical protein
MSMSSRYTTTKELVNDGKMSSIILKKVSRALVKTKGMTNQSKRPSLELKVVFHTSVCSISTQWYPDLRSILLNCLAPLSWSRRSSIQGMGY